MRPGAIVGKNRLDVLFSGVYGGAVSIVCVGSRVSGSRVAVLGRTVGRGRCHGDGTMAG